MIVRGGFCGKCMRAGRCEVEGIGHDEDSGSCFVETRLILWMCCGVGESYRGMFWRDWFVGLALLFLCFWGVLRANLGFLSGFRVF